MRNDELYTQIKDLMAAQKTAINAETKASADMINLRITEIIKRQDQINGHVTENCDRINAMERQTRFIRWMHRNPSFAVILMGFLAMGILFAVSYLGVDVILKLF